MQPRKNRVEFSPTLISQSETIFNGLKLLKMKDHFAVFFYAETMSFLVELQRVCNRDREFSLQVDDTFEFIGSGAEVVLRDELHKNKTKLEDILDFLVGEYNTFRSGPPLLNNCFTFSLNLYLSLANNSSPPDLSLLYITVNTIVPREKNSYNHIQTLMFSPPLAPSCKLST